MTDPPIDITQAREQDAPGTHDAKRRAPVHGHTGDVPSDKALSDRFFLHRICIEWEAKKCKVRLRSDSWGYSVCDILTSGDDFLKGNTLAHSRRELRG
eukprot:scaffold5558_cov131-Isochrysis_galbana.AAC.7